MQIVIDIDEETLQDLYDSRYVSPHIKDVFRNGTPLPKGHGRLIDADYLKDVILLHNYHGNNKYFVPYRDRKGYRLRDGEVNEAIINAPTIIEADMK